MTDATHAALCRIAADHGWSDELAASLANIALRRWHSYARRHKGKPSPVSRVQDLLQGLRQRSPVDRVYVEPGSYERLAADFAVHLEGL